MLSPGNFVTLSSRVYGVLLYLYPASFRREYGYHMAQLFRDDLWATWQASGPAAVLGLWLLALVDVLQTAVAEHVWEVFHMPVHRLTRWSGPAGAVGVLLQVMIVAVWTAGPMVSRAGFVLSLLLFLATAPLVGWGLSGLYQCLPAAARRLGALAFILSVAGVLIFISSVVVLLWTDNPPGYLGISTVGLGLYAVGLAGLALATMATKALARHSVAPLLITVALLALALVGSGVHPSSTRVVLPGAAYLAGWLWLSLALWEAHEESKPPQPERLVRSAPNPTKGEFDMKDSTVAKFAYAAALFFVAGLLVIFSLDQPDRLTDTPLAVYLFTIFGLALYLSLLPVIAALPAPLWAKVSGFAWAIVSNILIMTVYYDQVPVMVDAMRMGIHIAAATWVFGAALGQQGSLRWLGFVAALALLGGSLIGPFVAGAQAAVPGLLLFVVWLVLTGRHLGRSDATAVHYREAPAG